MPVPNPDTLNSAEHELEAKLRALLTAAIGRCRPAICLPPFIPAPPKGRTIVVGAGKAAAAMAQTLEVQFQGEFSGLVVTRYGSALPCARIRVLEAAHPLADHASESAARQMIAAVRELGPDDLVIALISGGGSALMSLPAPPLVLAVKQQVIDRLMRAGAAICEINCVRIALSDIKGGGLSRAIGPAACLSLIISDVVGDNPAMIASGPTVPQLVDMGAARAILKNYGIAVDGALATVLDRPQTKQDCAPMGPRKAVIVASPDLALKAALCRAEEFGLTAKVLDRAMEGSPSEAAERHIAALRDSAPGTLILSGGELTGTVKGTGKGGPNSAFCLEMLARLADVDELAGKCWVLAADTDGIDGNSGVAGAIVRSGTSALAAQLGLSIDAFRANSDSAGLFERLGNQIVTGPTQTNVNDFRVVVRIA